MASPSYFRGTGVCFFDPALPVKNLAALPVVVGFHNRGCRQRLAGSWNQPFLLAGFLFLNNLVNGFNRILNRMALCVGFGLLRQLHQFAVMFI